MIKRGSLSLSTNAIIVLILAITMLGMALVFIKTMFGKTSAQVEAIAGTEPEPVPATPDKPLTLSRNTLVLSPSEKTGIKFSTYKGATINNDPSLVGYWSFDNNYNDTSGANKYAIPLGGVSFTAGKVGQAVDFDGVTGYLSLPSNTNTKLQNNINTVAMWAYIRSVGANAYAELYSVTGGSRTGIKWETTRIGVDANGDFYNYFVLVSLTYNTWNHIVVEIDRTINKAKVYVNGVYKGQTSAWVSYIPTATTPRIGSNSLTGNTGDFIKGTIDEVAIYNRALSPAEIKNIAQSNLLAVKGCTGTSGALTILSQIPEPVESGKSITSQVVIQAGNTPVDTACEICTEIFAGGGCTDVRVIIK